MYNKTYSFWLTIDLNWQYTEYTSGILSSVVWLFDSDGNMVARSRSHLEKDDFERQVNNHKKQVEKYDRASVEIWDEQGHTIKTKNLKTSETKYQETMTTITCEFLSEGKRVTKTAILSDDLTTLSKSKKNQAHDTINYDADGRWSIFFDDTECTYEVEFDIENGQRTLYGIDAITYNDNGIITDVQGVEVTIK